MRANSSRPFVISWLIHSERSLGRTLDGLTGHRRHFWRPIVKAVDVMTTDVIIAWPQDTVQKLAVLLLEHRISAVPVVDEDGMLVGIVSEGDLMRRAEIGT